MVKEHLHLSPADERHLLTLLSKGRLPVRTYQRAQALLALHEGKTYREVAKLVGKTYSTVSNWAKKYRESGLVFLQDRARPGRPLGLGEEDRARITALANSAPPEGYARWSLRLLAKKLVELGVVDSISFKQVGNILKQANTSFTET